MQTCSIMPFIRRKIQNSATFMVFVYNLSRSNEASQSKIFTQAPSCNIPPEVIKESGSAFKA